MTEEQWFEVQPGRCWWCGSPANSREHRLKKSDLVREYGKPPFQGLCTLTRFSGGERHDFRGPASKLVQFEPTMCADCNNARSQRFDRAWDRLARYLADHEAPILADRRLDLRAVFGDKWSEHSRDVERYVVKHLICRIVDQLPGPIRLDVAYLEFLDGGPRPPSLDIDLCIDLGVVELLRVTRASPPAEQPDAAGAGFLGTTDLWVQHHSTGVWSEPQAGLYYRWLGVFWRAGADNARSVLASRIVDLPISNDMFGLEFRQALQLATSAGALPATDEAEGLDLQR